MDLDLLVLGDVNPDLVLRGGEVVPAFGQAERLVEEARLTVGGSGAIMACGAARLGLHVAVAGVVGDDLFGAYMRDRLVARGVDVRGLTVDADRATGVTVVLASSDDRAMLTAPGTTGVLNGSLVDLDLLRSARHVHVSSYFLQRGLRPDLPDLLAAAQRAGASTSVDPNWDPDGEWDGGLRALMPSVDVLLPNEVEARQLAHISDLDAAMAALRDRGPLVVVKAGADGAIALGPGERVSLTAVPVDAVDTTGAGDSFDAGFVAAMLGGEPLERCLAIANACGALSTRAVGGTDAQPTMQEALEAIERGSAA
ncbi:MAG: sugar kinase [Actinomycetota bacterium]|nr:sugar kinase [Actinomycetota bacterium]MDH5223827.1 sugar kinase [Actinomycetota bacterium]MDH5313386.1 sugar kinase [Actinomycetota bacterium]